MAFIVNIMIIPAINTYFNYKQNRVCNDRKPFCSDFLAGKNILLKPLACDSVSFTSFTSSGAGILKELAKYGITDLYTGLVLLYHKQLEYYLRTSAFNKDISEVVKILEKCKEVLLPVELKISLILKEIAQKRPKLKLNEALREVYPQYQKKLLSIQQPIFEELICKACEMPHKTFCEFMELMTITNKKISKDPVILPFSAKEFIYKLNRAAIPILNKNNRKEVLAFHKLISTAKGIYWEELSNKSRKSRGKITNISELKQDDLKERSQKFHYLRELFNSSILHKNKDLLKIFDNMSARIHHFPAIIPFQRKTFIYDLKRIVHTLNDKKLANELMNIAQKLPTSTNEVSAFIVKYANETSDNIGFNLLNGSICSVDHLIPKNKGGKNRLLNFGLSSIRINSLKTNISFDDWVRAHPEIYENAQKHFDILIKLYKSGIFEKISQGNKHKLTIQYIYDLADTLYSISPKEKPIVIDLSKLNN